MVSRLFHRRYGWLAFVSALVVVFSGLTALPAIADDTHSWSAGGSVVVASQAEGFSTAPTGSVTISNKGSEQIEGITASITGADASVFELGTCATSINVPTTFFGMTFGGTGTCTVRGKVGTPVGSYSATLELNATDTNPLSIPITWQVSKPLNVTVQGGTAASATAPAGGTVRITAGAAPEGQEFDHWEIVSGGATLDNASTSPATLTMGSEDAVVKAVFRDVPQPNPPYYAPVFQVVENQCANVMYGDMATATCWTDDGKNFYVRLEVLRANLQDTTSVNVQDTTALHFLGGQKVTSPRNTRNIPIDGHTPDGHPYVVLQADNWTTQGHGVNFMPRDSAMTIVNSVNRGTDTTPVAAGHQKSRNTMQEFFHPLSQPLSYETTDDGKVTLTMRTENPSTIEKLGTIEIFPVDDNYQWRGDKQYDDADLDGYDRGGMECSIGNTDPDGCAITIDTATGEAKVTFPRQDGWNRIQYITWMTDTNAVDPFKTYTMRPYQGQIPLPSTGKVQVAKKVAGTAAGRAPANFDYTGTLSYPDGAEHQEYEVTDDSWDGKKWAGEQDFAFTGDNTTWSTRDGGTSDAWTVPTGAVVSVTENESALPAVLHAQWSVTADRAVTVTRDTTHILNVTNTLDLTITPPVGNPDETWGGKNKQQTGTPTFEVTTPYALDGTDNAIVTISLLDKDGNPATTVTVDEGTYRLEEDGTITFTPNTDFVGDPTPVAVRGTDKNNQSAETTYTPHVVDNVASKTVAREITYTYITVDGEKVTENARQEVTFTVEREVDPKTGTLSDVDWSIVPAKEFPAITSPDITADGWVTDRVVVEAATVRATDTDMIEHVVYVEKGDDTPQPTPTPTTPEPTPTSPSPTPTTPEPTPTTPEPIPTTPEPTPSVPEPTPTAPTPTPTTPEPTPTTPEPTPTTPTVTPTPPDLTPAPPSGNPTTTPPAPQLVNTGASLMIPAGITLVLLIVGGAIAFIASRRRGE